MTMGIKHTDTHTHTQPNGHVKYDYEKETHTHTHTHTHTLCTATLQPKGTICIVPCSLTVITAYIVMCLMRFLSFVLFLSFPFTMNTHTHTHTHPHTQPVLGIVISSKTCKV